MQGHRMEPIIEIFHYELLHISYLSFAIWCFDFLIFGNEIDDFYMTFSLHSEFISSTVISQQTFTKSPI